MNEEELKNRNDGYISAVREFAGWYKNIYLNVHSLCLKK